VDGVRVIEILDEDVPATAVIVMAEQQNLNELRNAMKAGARDLLVKPMQSQDVIASVHSVYEGELQRRSRNAARGGDGAPPRPTRGKVICMFSPKGGTGRTTMTVNTAIAIRQLTGRKVAVVDCNLPFGDVGIVMNLLARKTIADLIPNVSDLSPELLDSVLAEHESGVRVLLAPTRPELAELVHPDHVKQIIEAVRRNYDYVLIDTWTSFHEVILAIFDLSSQIALITTLDMPAVKNIRLFLDVCEAIRFPRENVLLILNRADSTGGLHVPEIEESIQHKFAATLVSAGQLVTASINRGIPFVTSDPEAPITRDVMELARQMLVPEDREALAPAAEAPAQEPKRRPALSRFVPAFQPRR
jgi:pilus assembly protein CpaE